MSIEDARRVVAAAGCACLLLSNVLGQSGTPCGVTRLSGVALAAAGDGTLYFADRRAGMVRKVDRSGVIGHVAGSGVRGFAGDGGPAISARIGSVTHLAVDLAGNLFLAEAEPARVRRVARDGTITTVAGNGEPGFEGDGGQATLASLCAAAGLAVDSLGNLYMAFGTPLLDTGSGGYRVRKVAPTGIITTVAIAGARPPAATGIASGPAAPGERVRSLAADADGTLYLSDGARIRKVTSEGVATTVAGMGWRGLGQADASDVSEILGVIADVETDGRGTLVFTEPNNNRIRKISPLGTLSTIAGDSGPSAALTLPRDLAVDQTGNVFFAETMSITGSPPENQVWRIRMVAPGGAVTAVIPWP